MTRLITTAAAMLAVAAATGMASGQSLADRIAEVRRQRAAEQARERMGTSQTGLLQRLLYTELSVDFNETPAREAIDFIRTALDINLIARYSDDPAGHGIDPSTPIMLKVDDLAAIDVLELVLEQCERIDGVTWQLRRGFIEVGTKERLASSGATEVRMYDVRELLYEPPQFENSPPVGMQGIHYDAAQHFGYGIGYGGLGGYGYPGALFGGAGYVGGYSYSGGLTTGLSGGFGPGSGRYYGSLPSSTGRYYRRGSGWTIDRNSSEEQAKRAEQIIELIIDLVEPAGWARNGGNWASIRYTDGVLIVRAPDFIQREIGGYPPVPKPKRVKHIDVKPAADDGSDSSGALGGT
jgi:hypothetical protein